jgi:hypothetical protein
MTASASTPVVLLLGTLQGRYGHRLPTLSTAASKGGAQRMTRIARRADSLLAFFGIYHRDYH